MNAADSGVTGRDSGSGMSEGLWPASGASAETELSSELVDSLSELPVLDLCPVLPLSELGVVLWCWVSSS